MLKVTLHIRKQNIFYYNRTVMGLDNDHGQRIVKVYGIQYTLNMIFDKQIANS